MTLVFNKWESYANYHVGISYQKIPNYGIQGFKLLKILTIYLLKANIQIFL